ncbi:hypothetical protein GCM10022285_37490 [Streptomyces tunisiensis]|uniref:Uncharacterized protein n=1 Tax=Streptomyces tunisiensis TaxID=948699 RepID=A0ABP7YRL4_9ACTN
MSLTNGGHGGIDRGTGEPGWAARGWRLAAGGWRLAAGGWRLGSIRRRAAGQRPAEGGGAASGGGRRGSVRRRAGKRA